REALLTAAGACIARETRTFADAAEALRSRAEVAALDPAARAAAQDAWRTAIDAWQRLELMQVGPQAPSTLPGGRGLRDRIYAWPLTSRCLIDEGLVSEAYASPAFASALVNVRGLGTVEQVLFDEGDANGCDVTSPINAEGTWAGLSPDERSARRAAYAEAAAADVHAQATALAHAWD